VSGRTVRRRAFAVVLALATGFGFGMLGSLLMRPAPAGVAAVSVAAATGTEPPLTRVLGNVVSGRIFEIDPSMLVVRTIFGRIVRVITTGTTVYAVHGSAVAGDRGALVVGGFIEVHGRPVGLGAFTAASVTLVPHFLGDRPGFEDRRSPFGG